MAAMTEHPTERPRKRPKKQSAMVRISEEAHLHLREMAAQGGEPMQAVLDKAVEQYRRQKFLAECDAAYAALQQDPEAWADYRQELAAWEVASMDGLEPEGDGGQERVTTDAGGSCG